MKSLFDHPELNMLTFDLMEKVGDQYEHLDDTIDVNGFVGRDVYLQIIHEAGFVHYIPIWEITNSRNFIP